MKIFFKIFLPLLIFCTAVNAKSLYSDNEFSQSQSSTNISANEFERKFRPYLESRIRDRERGAQAAAEKSIGANIARPTTSDYFLMMNMWDDLSDDFRELYKLATSAALDGLDTFYISTSGRFKIHYSTTGRHAVDLTDVLTVGGNTPSSWRDRRNAPNGIPDYIDETAFALDSAYSMIVGRFEFFEPINSPDENGSTDHYNILILSFSDDALYGSAIPVSRVSQSQPGWSSYIEMNNDFTSPIFGYAETPEYAIYVTCVHELFHASQFAMTWSSGLFPLSLGFLEGSAVLMEEIAFPDINDYLQYTRTYFSNPRMSMLNDRNIYTNSIIMKYIYEKGNSQDSIGFVREILFNNLEQRNLNFHRNLEMSANAHAKKSWAELLNAFHAESYFTGNRSRPWAFVSDAPLMRTWNVPTATQLPANDSLRYDSNSARYFYYTPRSSHNDTLTISIRGVNDAAFIGQTWAASVLIMENADSVRIETIPMNANGTGIFEIANWKDKHGAIAVVSNGAPTARAARVQASTHGEDIDTTTPNNNDTIPTNVFPNVVSLRDGKSINIHGSHITDITISTQDGRLLTRYNQNSRSRMFSLNSNENVIEWQPNNIVPGIYFVTVSSRNPTSNARSTLRRKIMITP